MSPRVRLSVTDIDCLLNELEQQATTQISSDEFFSAVLNRFQAIVGGDYAAIFVSTGARSLSLRSSIGVLPPNLSKVVSGHLDADAILNSTQIKHEGTGNFFAFPWPVGASPIGVLVVGFFEDKLAGSNLAIEQLGAAFAEVLQVHALCKFQELIRDRWTAWCKVCNSLSQTNSLETAFQVLVDGLQGILSADRVSIVDSRSLMVSRQVIVVSGHKTISNKNPLAMSLAKVASQVRSKKQIHVSSSENQAGETGKVAFDGQTGLFHNIIAFPLVRDNETGGWEKRTIVVVEWQCKRGMLDGMMALSMLNLPFGVIWNQQKRWLLVPRWIRVFSESSGVNLVLRAGLRGLMWLVLAISVLAIINFLSRPKEMLIEADAVLEPTNRRAIFASADGFVKLLHTDVGKYVKKGDVLVELSSPSLELQIEETRGEILATLEKQNGLEVTLSQISQNNGDNAANFTRLTADIAMLRSQTTSLREKLDVLNEEKTRLRIESPINGTVVSRNLKSELESRPVRRGDALFAIADLDGGWQMQARVADRDTNYLFNRFNVETGRVKVIFDSLPDETFDGKVTEVGMTLESTLDRGVFLPVIVGIDSQIASRAKTGSTAKVMFSCGEEPLWFIWSRPAVDLFKRNYWLYFSRHIQ